MNVFEFGRSSCGLPLLGYHKVGIGKHIMLLAGVHGDEWEGVAVAKHFLAERVMDVTKFSVTVVPIFNLSGFLNGTRSNINGVDLNRNLPTKDWTSEVFDERYYPGLKPNSEVENIALTEYISGNSIDLIISLHSWQHALMNINGDCLAEARLAQKYNCLDIKEDIGYPTPGCLGTYGVENGIPVITYEIKKDSLTRKNLTMHVKALTNIFEV